MYRVVSERPKQDVGRDAAEESVDANLAPVRVAGRCCFMGLRSVNKLMGGGQAWTLDLWICRASERGARVCVCVEGGLGDFGLTTT